MDDLEYAATQHEQALTIQRLEAMVDAAEQCDDGLDWIIKQLVVNVQNQLNLARKRLGYLQRCTAHYRRNQQRLQSERRIRKLMQRHRVTRDQALLYLQMESQALARHVPSMDSERRAALRQALDNLSKPKPRNGFDALRLLLERLQHALDDVKEIG